jgi:hypothetical protein
VLASPLTLSSAAHSSEMTTLLTPSLLPALRSHSMTLFETLKAAFRPYRSFREKAANTKPSPARWSLNKIRHQHCRGLYFLYRVSERSQSQCRRTTAKKILFVQTDHPPPELPSRPASHCHRVQISTGCDFATCHKHTTDEGHRPRIDCVEQEPSRAKVATIIVGDTMKPINRVLGTLIIAACSVRIGAAAIASVMVTGRRHLAHIWLAKNKLDVNVNICAVSRQPQCEKQERGGEKEGSHRAPKIAVTACVAVE